MRRASVRIPQLDPGPLDEHAEGRVTRGALPVTATPVIVGAAGAIVIAYAAGRIVGEIRPTQ
ncbi:hypothetical protein D7319_07270 [Streptomyces radicis]|uniref:Uncharacterized protein n=1 Tax=Streptomyces radicis TaxID=1750517 RepID=A0A3A9WTJ5_9ACTN|nr:hypothetical protein D7319_07270 [Streptomyces radicis]RKN25416.1 hypothetical protein D7318_08125 [Streptomyces radicis]